MSTTRLGVAFLHPLGALQVLGTSSGKVVILDHSGNSVHVIRHAEAVTSVDMDAFGEFVLSSSTDGKVHLTTISTREVLGLTHPKAISCVALNPKFGKETRKNDTFVVGKLEGSSLFLAVS